MADYYLLSLLPLLIRSTVQEKPVLLEEQIPRGANSFLEGLNPFEKGGRKW